jgi:hypothetical protein
MIMPEGSKIVCNEYLTIPASRGYRAILKVIKRAIANDRSIISGKAEEFSLPISRPMRE